MSLNIYTQSEELPNGMQLIQVNDTVFNGWVPIRDNTLVAEILLRVDKAVRYDDNSFVSQTGSIVLKEHLSTGTKTLLNILEFPQKCFNVVECGRSALSLLSKFSTGNILWKIPVVAYEGSPQCDIMFQGKHFIDFYAFLNYCRYEADI